MAANSILLGLLYCIALSSSWRPDRNPIKDDAPYQRIIAFAQKEIGTREAAVPNTGKKVSEYLRYTGIKIPAPWCAAWLSYVFGQAGYPAPKTAWSPALFPAARQVKEAAPGLVLGIYYPSLKRIGHCGIVERVSGDWCMSIEGNTSATNERDGDGVWRRTRHKRSIYRYADWIKGQTIASKKGVGHDL